MATLRDAISSSISNDVCNFLESAAILSAASLPVLGVLAPEAVLPVGAIGAGTAASYSLFCNRPAPSLVGAPPFVGGQCDNVEYRVFYEGEYNNGSPNVFQTFADRTQYRNARVLGITTADPSDGSFGKVVVVQFEDGDVTGFGFTGIPPNGNQMRNVRITSVQRRDGQPDNCGNPPGLPVPPGDLNVTNNNSVTYIDNNGDTITNNFGYTYSPIEIDFNGNVTIPVNIRGIDLPDFNINANINLTTGDINFYGGNSTQPPSGVPRPSDYVPDPSLPEPPSDIPGIPSLPFPSDDNPPETEKIISACIVTVSQVGRRQSVIFQGDNPDIYAPNLGFVAFAINTGGATSWTSDIAVKNLRNFIPCPWQPGAIAVRGTPQPGVSFVVTPVYTAKSVE